jgi:hypothetical protein
MNFFSQNTSSQNSVSGDAEATLRLIASLPAPEGLEDRVQAGLRAAPRKARILHWPAALLPASGLAGNWMRGAAAAAIVFVVAGGGWGIYSRVQPSPAVKVIVMPARAGAASGFSNAGAMRTPQTLNGPVLVHPATTQTTKIKPAAPAAKSPLHGAKPRSSGNAAAVLPAN